MLECCGWKDETRHIRGGHDPSDRRHPWALQRGASRQCQEHHPEVH